MCNELPALKLIHLELDLASECTLKGWILLLSAGFIVALASSSLRKCKIILQYFFIIFSLNIFCLKNSIITAKIPFPAKQV